MSQENGQATATAPQGKAPQEKSRIKNHKFQIVGWCDGTVEGAAQEVRARYKAMSDDVRELTNFIYQEWENWHISRDNHIKAKRFMDDFRRWRRDGIGEKPKHGINYWDPNFAKDLRLRVNDRFPHLNNRIPDNTYQNVKKALNGKDSDGSWNRWMSILAGRQARPSAERSQPIPFETRNTNLLRSGNNLQLEIWLTRVPKPAKPGKEKEPPAGRIVDRLTLKTKGKGAVVADKILNGDWEFCGSNITHDPVRNRWYANVAFDVGKTPTPKTNPANVAIFFPGKKVPWIIRTAKRKKWVFGRDGRHIASARRSLLTQRWSRQDTYRYGGTANKGHGIRRALAGLWRLSKRWKNFTKNCNHQTTHDVVEFCKTNGIGTLIYLQPATEKKRANRFVSTVGKIPGRRDGTGWDFFQVGTILGYKCADAGIALQIMKCEGGAKSANEPEPARESRSKKSKKITKKKRPSYCHGCGERIMVNSQAITDGIRKYCSDECKTTEVIHRSLAEDLKHVDLDSQFDPTKYTGEADIET